MASCLVTSGRGLACHRSLISPDGGFLGAQREAGCLERHILVVGG